jgi:hypothetical protein
VIDQAQLLTTTPPTIFLPRQVARTELREMLEPYMALGAVVVTSVYHPPFWKPCIADETYNLNMYDKSSCLSSN